MATAPDELSTTDPVLDSTTDYDSLGGSVDTALLDPPERSHNRQRRRASVGRKSTANTTDKSNKTERRAQFDAERQRRLASGLDWAVVIWTVVIHLGVLAAPFTFTWAGLAVWFALAWLTGSIGICLGFHRLFTHRSFSTSRPMRWLIAFIGGLAGEGSVVHWVANHRKHHALSDQPGDPHSPEDGAWWSHMIWLVPAMTPEQYASHNRRWAPDLAKDPVMNFLDKTFILWHLLMGAGLFAAGYAFGGAALGWSLLVWGMFVRLFVVLHATWLVNSASHMWGYRSYETTDDSRNNWWVALVTFGEGWHNNHHAFPTMARAGHRWWEIDTTFWVIKTLEKVGLVWDVVDGYHKREQQS